MSEPFVLQINVLSLDARLDMRALLQRPITLHTTLSDGSEQPPT